MKISADSTDYQQFITNYCEGLPVSINRSGEIHPRGVFDQLTYCFTSENALAQKVARIFCGFLDEVERKELCLNKVESFEQVLEHVGKLESALTTKTEGASLFPLRRRLVALQYRIQSSNPCDREFLTFLRERAESWKRNHPLYGETGLTEEDKEMLQKAATYSLLRPLLEQNKSFEDDLFKWILRDKNNVDVFVQYPAVQSRVKFSLLSGRVSRFSEKTFSIHIKKRGQKVPTIPIEVEKKGALKVRKISLLNESEKFTLRGGLVLDLKSILRVFQRKNHEIGDLEFLNGAIRLWHCHKFGWKREDGGYDLIDLTKETWYEDLPLFEEITGDEVFSRFGIRPGPRNWLLNVRSSRESPILDIDKTHGYEELIAPLPNGNYKVMTFGKFASTFPVTPLEKLCFVTSTTPSTVSYPDENTFYTQRQQAIVSYEVTEDQAKAILQRRAEDIKLSKEGNLVFQFAWENCAYLPDSDVAHLFPEKKPNFFHVKLMECDSEGPLRYLFKFVRAFPKKIENALVLIITFLLGAFRKMWVEIPNPETRRVEKVAKSVWTCGFRKELKIVQPSYLHLQILSGEVEGRITFGQGRDNRVDKGDKLCHSHSQSDRQPPILTFQGQMENAIS